MAYYPKIATLFYKDNRINIKIPIRIKLIKMLVLNCSKCHTEGTLRKLGEYYSESHKGVIEKVFLKELQDGFPKDLIEGCHFLCPVCKTQLTPKEMDKIKAYTAGKADFIRIDRILDKFTLARWRPDGVVAYAPSGYAFFEKNIDDAYLRLNWTRQQIKKKAKGFDNLKFIIHRNITMKQLQKEYKEFRKRKVEGAI